MNEPIRLETLRELAEAGGVRDVLIEGREGGYAVTASLLQDYGRTRHALITKRGEVRVFASLDTAVRTLSEAGLPQVAVDVRQLQASSAPRVRPDAARRLQDGDAAMRELQGIREQIEPIVHRLRQGKGKLNKHDDVWAELMAYAEQQLTERDSAKMDGKASVKARNRLKK